jgi:hypothetical protein
MNYQTRLFENLNFATNSRYSFYGLDSIGRTINTFYYSQAKKLMRITSLSATLDFDLGQIFKGKDKNKKPPVNLPVTNPEDDGSGSVSGRTSDESKSLGNSDINRDKYGYVKFDVPWTMRVAYNFYYTKSAFKPVISQTLALNGDVSLTKKTKISYTTGYDIARKQITMTSVGIYRDLHCWEMSLDWIPIGYLKSWNFTLRVKASVLADLKYERRKDFRDQY